MQSSGTYGTGVRFIARFWLAMAFLFAFLHVQANCNPAHRKKLLEKELSLTVFCQNQQQISSETDNFLNHYDGSFQENLISFSRTEEIVNQQCCNSTRPACIYPGRYLWPGIQIGAP